MAYTYISVDILKGTAALALNTTAYDTRLREITENVTREFDRFMNRTLHPHTRTLYFGGDGGKELLVPDLIAVTSIKEDNNLDGTFNVTWSSDDYFLMPHNADPTSEWGRPYTSIQVSDRTVGTQDAFERGIKNYEIVGTWGYIDVTRDTGRNTSASIDSTATAIDLDGSVGSALLIGMVIQVESEQMYVSDVGTSGPTGTQITVRRGQNGSTAGTHAADTDISYYVHPGPVMEAALIQTARLWSRRDSGFANEVGFLETGRMVTFKGIDDDVKQLLGPYRKIAI